MTTAVGTDWVFDVERGPEWLIVRLVSPPPWQWAGGAPSLADQLWQICQQHFTWRLVLDLERLPLLTSPLLGQLLILQGLVRERGGILRLCGVSAQQANALRLSRLESKLPLYHSARDAVLGFCRAKPK